MKSFDENPKYDRIKGGDDGLDIVAFLPIDKAQVIPFAFAQCTCSFEQWVTKQHSAGMDEWNAKIGPLVSYPVFMFVPFSCHDNLGKFYDTTSIYTFLIDRIRIVNLIDKNKDDMHRKMTVDFKYVFALDNVFD